MHIAYQFTFIAIGIIGFASMLQSSLHSTTLRSNAAILEVADPKSINSEETKAVTDAVDALFAQTRQKSPKNAARLRALVQQEIDTEGLRIAVFGSSNAWGASLEDRFLAYPFLLSPRVHNYAHYTTGLNYYAACLETVVGEDNIFDVIILDYWLKNHEGLSYLAHRLRQRFPKAILIFLKMWAPIHFRQKPDADSVQDFDFASWKTKNGLDGSDLHTVIAAVEEDQGYWYFPDHPNAKESIAAVAYRERAYMFSFPFKPDHQGGVKATLIGYLGLYDEFGHSHVSLIGHEAIARNLKHIINNNNPLSHNELVNRSAYGNFGARDSCHIWYSTGIASSISFYGSLAMVEVDTHARKFAIEVTGDGGFTIENPFSDERPLYLSFLTSTSMGIYSNAIVSFGTWTFELDPFNTKDPWHEVETVEVGMIPPGEHTIAIKLAGGTNVFRWVGASFSDENAGPFKYGFEPTYHH